MSELSKKDPRIVLLYGGVGLEREVSLVTGRAMLAGMAHAFPYEVCGIELMDSRLPEELRPAADVVILGLHGEFGEDGQLQALLESAGVEYCGCDARSSALCMDKARTKEVWCRAGLPVVPGQVLSAASWSELDGAKLWEQFGQDLVIKPIGMGSSVGLHLIEARDELFQFLNDREHQKGVWLLEQRIRGREFSVGVLNGDAMGIVEIKVPQNRIYDYEQKYQRSDTVYECPASLNRTQTEHVQRMARTAYHACGCRDYARIDFLYDPESDSWYCLELNTLPGMTPTSLLPKSAAAVGFDFDALLMNMVEQAVMRFKNREDG